MTEERTVFEHAEQHLVRDSSGGFELQTDEGPTVRARFSGNDWRIEGIEGWADSILRRDAESSGFVLEIQGENQGEIQGKAARTMSLVGVEWAGSPRFMLLVDGRLYRIAHRGPRDVGFELAGWESPGAYLVAIPTDKGWKIEAMVAATGLDEISTMSLLFAAEILEAERTLGDV